MKINLQKIGIYKIDRYVIKKFLSTYIFLIGIIITIAIIFDFNEKIDKFTQSGATLTQVVVDYYEIGRAHV